MCSYTQRSPRRPREAGPASIARGPSRPVMNWDVVLALVLILIPTLDLLVGNNIVPHLWRSAREGSWGPPLKRLCLGLCAIVGIVLWLVVAPTAFCLRCASKSIALDCQLGKTGERAEVPRSIPFGRGAPRLRTLMVGTTDLTARQPRAPSRCRSHRRGEASGGHRGTRRPGPQTALNALVGGRRSQPLRPARPPSGSDTIVPAPEAAPSRRNPPIRPTAPTAETPHVLPPSQLMLIEIDLLIDGPRETLTP